MTVEEFAYEIRRSKRLSSSTTISIKPDGRVIVSAPSWVPKFVINNFVNEKRSWIIDRLNKLKTDSKLSDLSSGKELLFFGQKIQLEIFKDISHIRTVFDLIDGKFVVKVSSLHSDDQLQIEVKTAMERWYVQQGIAVITEKVNRFSAVIGVDYSKITIKKVSSIWGSCSYKNNLSFNRKLIMAPHDIVDYVVIHEVCHMVHRNHSSRFWGLVCKLDPNYRQHRHWLKTNSHILSI